MQTSNMSKMITIDYDLGIETQKNKIKEIESQIEEKKAEDITHLSRDDVMAKALELKESLEIKSKAINLFRGKGIIPKDLCEPIEKKINDALAELDNIINTEV